MLIASFVSDRCHSSDKLPQEPNLVLLVFSSFGVMRGCDAYRIHDSFRLSHRSLVFKGISEC
jgi:hypothetical protein